MWRLALIGILSGCGSTVIAVADYSQVCAVATDCVAVSDGDVCQPCRCPTKAIAVSEQARFRADSDSAASWCGTPERVACSPCQQPTPVCTNGVCGVSLTP